MISVELTTDYKAIACLNREVQELHRKNYPKEFKPFHKKAVEQAIREMIDDDNTFAYIATKEDEAIAYALCFIQIKAESAFQYKKTIVKVDQIVVDSKHRNMGIARMLLQIIENYARRKGINEIQLDHWEKNLAAKKFFMQNGFIDFKHQMKKVL